MIKNRSNSGSSFPLDRRDAARSMTCWIKPMRFFSLRSNFKLEAEGSREATERTQDARQHHETEPWASLTFSWTRKNLKCFTGHCLELFHLQVAETQLQLFKEKVNKYLWAFYTGRSGIASLWLYLVKATILKG